MGKALDPELGEPGHALPQAYPLGLSNLSSWYKGGGPCLPTDLLSTPCLPDTGGLL